MRLRRLCQRIGMFNPQLQRPGQDHPEHGLRPQLKLLPRGNVVHQGGPSHVERSLLRELNQVEGWDRSARTAEQHHVSAGLSTLSPLSKVVLPTESYTTSTPLPPVRRRV